MTNSPPRTVDISAEAVSPSFAGASVARSRDYSAAIKQSISVDLVLLLVSLVVGFLFSVIVSTIEVPSDIVEGARLLPPQWLILFACLAPALLSLFTDGISVLSNPAALPYARSQSSSQAIYFKRVHSLLLAFYFTAIVVALCWSAITMPLFSKLFVSAIFSFALFALGHSIPSKRTSFVVSGVLFLVVLIATQVFIVKRLEADAGMTNQRVLDELVEPERRLEEFF